jgi:hypothetical protein
MEKDFKVCSRCQVAKPASAFSTRGGGKLVSHCKECNARYHRQRYEQDKRAYVARNREYRNRLKAIIRAAKAKPCADCGKRYPSYVMDFDHRPGERKVGTLTALASRGLCEENIRLEIAKCDVVCANCHRKRTHRRKRELARERLAKLREGTV